MRRSLLAAMLLVTAVACARGDDSDSAATTTRVVTSTTVDTTEDVDLTDAAVLYAVGDIADCDVVNDEATAALLEDRPGPVATLGDNVYESGSPGQFARCYAPGWGRLKTRTHPSVGNHEYGTPGAAGYFDYFGSAAGRRGEGWYSYTVGDWHVIALNSNCDRVGCGADSAQGRWLQADLAANASRCMLAYFHHPRFSSGLHGSTEAMAALYTMLYEAGADVVLGGHDHHYERTAPLDPGGRLDLERGIRNFTVGTGGKSLYPTFFPIPGSEIRASGTYGVLELQLASDGYGWEFLRATGEPFTDRGSGRCH
jgi:hypothetical protein